jgi:uncharacterized protein (TIGR03437 family)
MSRRFRFQLVLALVVLALSTGTAQATNVLTATPSAITVSCNTATGPAAAATVTIKPVTALTGASTIAVTLAAPGGGIQVTPPQSQTLNAANSAAGITYSFVLPNGCVGVTAGPQTLQFKQGGTNDVTVTATVSLTATTSGLAPSPAAVTVTCVKSGSTYTPGAAQTVAVTSTATGGTAFTVDNSGTPLPAWLSVSPMGGGTATGSAVNLSFAALSPCNSLSVGGSTTATVHLLNAPGPDKTIPVTIQVLNPSPLTASVSPANLSYTKGSGTPAHVDVNFTASSASFFTVDTTSLPIWLTVDSTSGTTPKSIRFSTTSIADNLALGTYSGSVRLKVSGYGDLSVPFNLLITNPAPRLSIAGGTTQNVTWTVGSAPPSVTITAVSTDSPIAYSITTGGTLAPVIAPGLLQGLAYSFGTPIPVTFSPLVFAGAQPGDVLTGTVTFTWGNPVSTIVVTINVRVQSAGATITAITPASLPTAASGSTFNVVLTGSGFVPSSDPTQKTKVGIVSSNVLITDTNIAVNVVNSSSIILTITAPVVADQYLPFSPSGNGGAVSLGVCNPLGTNCSVPTGTATLTIGSIPIVQAITSASSFIEVNPGSNPNIAPYDIISIFGSNFCSSGGSGCSSSQVLYGSPDPVTHTYPTSLSPDPSGATQRNLTVTFQTHASTPVVIATGHLLFATNNQINLVAPSQLFASIGNPVDVVVSFGYGSSSNMLSSVAYSINVVSSDPGVFTVGSDGQGSGAILATNWSLISANAPAGMRSNANDSDTIQIYMTGLGVPDSSADNGSAGAGPAAVWSTDCASIASFLTSLNTITGASPALTTLDGVVLSDQWINTYRLVPCIGSSSSALPSVMIGGQPALVSFAGWVADSIAGLYQVNAQLPPTTAASGTFTTAAGASVATITAPVQLPVVVTSNNHSSQPGVTVWVTPRLKVVAPTALTGTAGIAWASSNNRVLASEGSPTYSYAITSGLLPSGLVINAGNGAISGTPAANTAGSYLVTVTATDSASVPVTGTVTFTLQIGAGLVLNAPGAPFTGTFGTANASLLTVVATGGAFPYTYAITSPSPVPNGLTIGSSSGVVGITNTFPAGTYQLTVTATDSASVTGTITFSIAVALELSHNTVSSVTAASGGTITTISTLGNTGTVGYTVDATSAGRGFAIDASGHLTYTPGSLSSGSYSVTVTATDGTAPTGASSAGTAQIVISVTLT